MNGLKAKYNFIELNNWAAKLFISVKRLKMASNTVVIQQQLKQTNRTVLYVPMD
jgi:hypothetical protein